VVKRLADLGLRMAIETKVMTDTLCVFGLGYVGLPTAVAFASKGFSVIGVDIDAGKVEAVNRGVSYLREPSLEGILGEAVASDKLRATTDADEALDLCDAVLIDAPTPVKDGVADLGHVVTCWARSLGDSVGVCWWLSSPLFRRVLLLVSPAGSWRGSGLRAEEDFFLVHAPERTVPGRASVELTNVLRELWGCWA